MNSKFDEVALDEKDYNGLSDYSQFSRISNLGSDFPTIRHDGNLSLIDENSYMSGQGDNPLMRSFEKIEQRKRRFRNEDIVMTPSSKSGFESNGTTPVKDIKKRGHK